MAEREAATEDLGHEWACAHLAIVHHASLYAVANGYPDRQEVTNILGLRRGGYDAPECRPPFLHHLDCPVGRPTREGAA